MNSLPAMALVEEARQREYTSPRLKARKGQKAKVINLLTHKKANKSHELSAHEREELILEYRLKARTLAHSILRKWHARLDVQEVESVVDLSLCESVRRFNKTKGASFMTFMFYHLRGNLIRAVTTAASLNFVPLPEADNFDASIEFGGKGANAIEIADNLCNHDYASPDELLLKKEIANISNLACSKLDPLEQEVINRIYVHEQQLMDIARSLGYSRCHISRVKKKALETLFDSLAPTVAGDRKLVRPNFDDEAEVKNVERRKIHRRRPRGKSAAHPRRIELAIASAATR